jgi:hypothetical protein
VTRPRGAGESREQAPGARRGRPSAAEYDHDGRSVTGTVGRVGGGASEVGRGMGEATGGSERFRK